MFDNIDDGRKSFLEAFAEPTEAYRMIDEYRQKNPLPLFLQRNLSYVKYKKNREKKKFKRRSSAKVHSINRMIDQLMEKKRGLKHYVTFTFDGIYDNDAIEIGQFAEVQLIEKESKSILFSPIVDINPNVPLKYRPVISLPTESLNITTSDGKFMNITSYVIQFKLKSIDKSDNPTIVTEMELINDAKTGLIASGNYEVIFENKINLIEQMSSTSTWRTRFRSLMAVCNQIDEKHTKPLKLKFHLQWSKELMIEEGENKENNGTTENGRSIFTRRRSIGAPLWGRSMSFTRTNDNIQRFTYQFIHRNYRQKTEVWDKFKCPWCIGRFSELYLLLKHLSLCHDYFKFKYVSSGNEIRIDVLVNKKSIDLRNDKFCRFGIEFKNEMPVKRNIATEIIVWRPDRYRPRLSEFFWNFDNELYDRKRTYYHSISGSVIRSNEIDENSDNEMDPEWLRTKMIRLIDDFIDVNDGEKEIMKFWNLHLMKYQYVSHSQIFQAMMDFIEKRGELILRKNLYRNLLLHICNLNGFGLLSAYQVNKCIQSIQLILTRNEKIREIIFKRFLEQNIFAKRKILIARRQFKRKTATEQSSKMLTETPRRKTDLNRKRHLSLRSDVKNKVQRTIVMTRKAARKSAQ